MQVAAVILAAGASTRFGSPKQLARIGSRTLLEAVADHAGEAGLHPIIAVVPSSLAVRPGVVPVINDAPREGLSRSLRLGLAAVPAEADAAVILLGDQPSVEVGTITALLQAARSGAPVAATEVDGRMAPPVLLARDAFALADRAEGDEGLRSILAGLASAPATVRLAEHPRDVDTIADLEALGERCHGCGALFERAIDQRATHEYIGSTAACWAAFGEVLAREFQDPSYGWIHRHTVDVYTVQHPGDDDRRQRQSVALHLVGLCHWLEHGLSAAQLNPITQRLASESRAWPWLEPPSAYPITVLDVLRATSGEAHAHAVRAWAESVWRAWSAHHAIVREWASGALGSRR